MIGYMGVLMIAVYALILVYRSPRTEVHVYSAAAHVSMHIMCMYSMLVYISTVWFITSFHINLRSIYSIEQFDRLLVRFNVVL